jgi:putative membrane protein
MFPITLYTICLNSKVDIHFQEPMTTLILNIDRDNDFGRKANINSPIIGIIDNKHAAQTFGEIDPEDSDLNAIYYAISIFKKLKQEEKDVEIATLCGHVNVGITSDEILANQLETVLEKTNATSVILITDGAEDEYIIPIIQSRIKITSIQRVSVKQSRQLEDTYYRVLKMLDDEKVLKQFILPIALVLIVWALFVLLNLGSSGFGAIIMTLGLYLVIRVFRLERTISYIGKEVKSGFLTGKLTIYTTIIGIVVLIASLFVAYANTELTNESEVLELLNFLSNMIWGIVIAGLLFVFGYVVDSYVKEKKAIWTYWIYPFSLLAFGFISSAILESLHKALINWPETFYVEPFFTPFFIGNTLTGIMISIVGAITYHYIKDMNQIKKNELSIDNQTS